jgi:hypothetical protein
MGRLCTGGAWSGLSGTVVYELECGNCLTHYVTLTCDLAGKAFNRTGDLVYLATTTAGSKAFQTHDAMVPDLKTTTPDHKE